MQYMAKKRYIKQFSNFEDESIECEILSTDNGSEFYITYDVNGKRLHTFGASGVGEILGVAGDTFTSKNGVWIYTWSKDGKKINTRAAK